jgi:hypothetical protein
MNLLQSLTQRWKRTQSPKKVTGRIVCVHWDRENLYYFVSSSKSLRVQTQDAGVLAYNAQQSPLLVLREHLGQQGIAVQQLVVLLSRPELEQLSLNLPPADDDELPALVASAVEQQLGDSELPPTVDFCSLPTARADTEGNSVQVLAFALTANGLQSLQRDAEQTGFKLVAIASRQLSAISLLKRITDLAPNLNVVLHLYPGEAELAFCIGDQPQLLRSVRVNLDELDRTVEQLQRETQRCLALLPHDVEELPQQWLVFDTCAAAEQISQLIENSLNTKVIRVDPTLQWDFLGPLQIVALKAEESSVGTQPEDLTRTDTGQGDSSSAAADSTSRQTSNNLINRADTVTRPTAALTGAAWEIWHEGLSVNLVNPKRAPQAPKPWVRPAAWSGAGLLAASIGGYALKTDVWQLQQDVESLQQQVQDSGKLAAKLLEKSDQAKVVENWLSDQVDWLAVLDEVSQRLPTGQDATVTRLNASTDAALGIFDLSVQVTDPEKIAELEERLRSVRYSVNSKRISQSPEASEYPWRFETRITFGIEPADWRDYATTTAVNSQAANETGEINNRPPKSSQAEKTPRKEAAP